jgi:hypothetical protein
MISEPPFPLDVPNRERVVQLTAALDNKARSLFGHCLPGCVKAIGMASVAGAGGGAECGQSAGAEEALSKPAVVASRLTRISHTK